MPRLFVALATPRLLAAGTLISLLCPPPLAAADRNIVRTAFLANPPFSTGGVNPTDGGDRVFVGRIDQGFDLLDVADPRSPRIVMEYRATGEDIREAAIAGGILVTTNSAGTGYGMKVWDLSAPGTPALVATITDPRDLDVHTAFLDGPILYAASEVTLRFTVYDLSVPSSPSRIAEIWDPDPAAEAHECMVRNGVFYGAFKDAGFTIADVSDPAAPVPLVRHRYPGAHTHSVWPSDDGLFAFTTDETLSPPGSVRVWDISDLAAITQVASYRKTPDSIAHLVVVVGDVAYVAHHEEGLVMLDVRDPAQPVELGSFDVDPVNQGLATAAWGVNPYGSGIVLSDLQRGVHVLRYLPDGTLAIGAGPGPSQGARVVGRDPRGNPVASLDLTAYGTPSGGANVGRGDLDADGRDDVVTGPGPRATFGPHVRAFDAGSAPFAKVGFFAYGTLRYGVNVDGGSLDGDAAAEIVTGAGHGAAFGPHVRGWQYDGAQVQPMAALNLFAFQTLRYGCNVAVWEGDGDVAGEVAAGPGPGPSFAARVRAFEANGAPVPGADAILLPGGFGAEVAAGDFDGDGRDALVAGAGAGASNGGAVCIREGSSSVTLSAHPYLYGAEVAAGDVDEDGLAELVVAPGPDPTAPSRIRGFQWDGATGVPLPDARLDVEGIPGTAYGARVTVLQIAY